MEKMTLIDLSEICGLIMFQIRFQLSFAPSDDESGFYCGLRGTIVTTAEGEIPTSRTKDNDIDNCGGKKQQICSNIIV